MRNAFVAILGLGIILIFALSGCSQKSSSSSVSPTPPLNSTVASSSAEDSKMESFILDKLLGHHSIDIVLSAQHTREEWNSTLDRMIARGAPISEQEKQVIIDWLIARRK